MGKGTGKSGSRNSPTAAKQVEKKSEPSAMDAQNVAELVKYMNSTYGLKLYKQDLERGDFEAVREQVSALEEVLQEFPGAKSSFKSIMVYNGADYEKAFAVATGTSIKLNSKYFSNRSLAEASYAKTVSVRFHPEGTTLKHITSHESGHILERAMANKYLPGTKNLGARLDAWKSGKFANDIIQQAANKLGKAEHILRREVSKYSLTNMSETLAECVADYMANRSKAKPLSKEVYKILKQELG